MNYPSTASPFRLKNLLIFAVLTLLSACGDHPTVQTSENNLQLPIPEPLRKIAARAASNFTVKAIIDAGTAQEQSFTLNNVTQNGNSIRGELTLKAGTHTLRLQYFAGDVLLATTTPVDVSVESGKTRETTLDASSMTYQDNDGDGFSNYAEVLANSAANDRLARPQAATPNIAPPQAASLAVTTNAQGQPEITFDFGGVADQFIVYAAPSTALSSSNYTSLADSTAVSAQVLAGATSANTIDNYRLAVSSPLRADTNYCFLIVARNAAGDTPSKSTICTRTLVAVIQGGGPTPAPDAPKILAIYPANAKTGVAVSLPKIDVTFDKAMAVASINADTLTVTANGQPVEGNTAYDQNGKTASFVFGRALLAGTQYTLQLSGAIKDAQGNALGAASTSYTTVLAALSIADVTVDETALTVTLNAKLDLTSGVPVTVDFATANDTATAPADFTVKSGSLTFAPGETSKTIVIPIVDDTLYETVEAFKVVFTNASGATLAKPQTIVTLNDNDTLPALSVADLQVSESVGSANVVASLNHPSAFPITVDFATANGAAVAPGDYTATSGKLTFAVGEISKSIPVLIVNDTTLEVAETLTVTLSNVSGATIADNSAVVTIQNDDAPAAPSVSLQNGDGQVTVNWADVAGATSYNIYYAKQTGVTPANYAAFTGGTALINVTSGRIITGLTNGTDYFFVVTALAGTLESNASPQRAAQPRGPAPVQPKLNDTGIDTCSTGGTNGLACPQAGFLNQDGDFGRDAQARAGTLQKSGSGSAGFDYTKIGANGQVLASNASQWDCVRDNVTGLLWENKQAAGSKTLRDANYTYTWFSGTNNGGSAGTANGGVCFDTTHCDTEKFAAEVNKQGLCGYSDWRLPSTDELSTLVNRRIAYPGPTLDTALFPATIASGYWSSSPFADSSGYAWGVYFNFGGVGSDDKTFSDYVRLVRGP